MKVHRPAPRCALIEGDSRAALRVFAADRFDSIVSDPPYELGFMGKGWDASGIAFDVEFWREALRVLKPGGHLLAFGGTRTYHRMTCAIEDAGFEVRDSLHWFYGTGFPKSLNVGGGRGTALKPAHEPIVMARKPLIGTVAANVRAFGTGALRIDDCRIATTDQTGNGATKSSGRAHDAVALEGAFATTTTTTTHPLGRWPANVLLDESAAADLDAQAPSAGAAAPVRGTEASAAVADDAITNARARVPGAFHADSGGASRFFYVAKPSRRERDQGCDHLPAKSGGEATDRADDSKGTQNPRAGAGRNGGTRNFHPTVKPVELMRYLVRLVTPAGGTVLDPFTGSGTTGMAARLEGLDFVGIEREPEYATIAAARIAGAA